MTVLTGQTVISLLRMRLSDDAAVKEAYSFKITDRAREVVLAIHSGVFRCTLINSVQAPDVVVDLQDPRYDTVRKLVNYLNTKPGYSVKLSDFAEGDFPSSELEFKDDVQEALSTGLKFYTRRFSDKELVQILDIAAKSHNINYSYQTIPEAESPLILDLAHARALRTLATESVKRQGLETSAEALLSQAVSYESSYKEVYERQRRAIPVPAINDDLIGEGDVISGKVFRNSLRFGGRAPRSVTTPVERPVLYDFREQDVGDDFVILRWKKPTQEHIGYMELWRDTQPNVQRVVSDLTLLKTSKRVMRVPRSYAFGPPLFETAVEQSSCSYIDGVANSDDTELPPVEPEVIYYYKLIYIDTNGLVVDSETVSVKTKRPRAKWHATTPLSVTSGPLTGGTEVTIKGTNFHSTMKVYIGDKPALYTHVNSTTGVISIPPVQSNYYKNRPLDAVLWSDTGLKSVLEKVWTYV